MSRPTEAMSRRRGPAAAAGPCGTFTRGPVAGNGLAVDADGRASSLNAGHWGTRMVREQAGRGCW